MIAPAPIETGPCRQRPGALLCRAAWLALALLPLAPAAAAQTEVEFGTDAATSDQPVEVTAAQLEVDRDAGTALFTGDVLVVQGALRLLGDVVDVHYGPGPEGETRIERVEATGNVVLLNGTDAAEGDRAIYTVQTGQVVMTAEAPRDVLLTQGANAMTGAQLTVNVDDGSGVMEGRVRVIFLPGEEDAGGTAP